MSIIGKKVKCKYYFQDNENAGCGSVIVTGLVLDKVRYVHSNDNYLIKITSSPTKLERQIITTTPEELIEVE